MRIAFLVTPLLACVALIACGRPKSSGAGTPAPAGNGATSTNSTLIVTAQEMRDGKIAWVNTDLRFVVVTFPAGRLPAVDQRLNVYRRGLKVAEIEISGPQTEDSIVADILTGEVETGDVASDK